MPSAQRQTIDNFQKDLQFDRNRMEKLNAEIASLRAKVESQHDYKALKLENKIGYQGGYELGMAKVSFHSL